MEPSFWKNYGIPVLDQFVLKNAEKSAYASHLADRHIAHVTIRVYLAGIAFHLKRLGHNIDYHTLPGLHYVILGIRRLQGGAL